MKRRIVTLAAVPLLVALALVACRAGERGPDRVVRRFLRALNDNDVNVALSCVDPRQERLLRASFRLVEKATGVPVHDLFEMIPGLHQSFSSQLRDEGRVTNVKIRDRSISGSTARLTVSITSKSRAGNRRDDFEFTLEKFEEDGWRIVAIRIAPEKTG